jgi:endonuclease-3
VMKTLDRSTKERADEIVARLKEEYPDAKVALDYSSPWELLVATILSAQTTDKKVNEVTKRLFKKYQSIYDYAKTPLDQFEQDIKTIGIYRNKAKYIKLSASQIIEQYGAEVPGNMKEMLTLPGVARKTANIVLGNAFNVVEGIAVDTHVKRLSARLGLSKNKDPDKIEKDLMEVFRQADWFCINYLLINHGRAICKAPIPQCHLCVLADICPSAFEFPGQQMSKKSER